MATASEEKCQNCGDEILGTPMIFGDRILCGMCHKEACGHDSKAGNASPGSHKVAASTGPACNPAFAAIAGMFFVGAAGCALLTLTNAMQDKPVEIQRTEMIGYVALGMLALCAGYLRTIAGKR